VATMRGRLWLSAAKGSWVEERIACSGGILVRWDIGLLETVKIPACHGVRSVGQVLVLFCFGPGSLVTCGADHRSGEVILAGAAESSATASCRCRWG